MAAMLLGGCPSCPTGSMTVVDGPDDGQVRAGDLLDLRASYGGWEAGPGECGGDWAVNHVRGGSPEVGTIDDCGHYVAPAVLPEGLELVFIEAADFSLAGDCADCCPYAWLELVPLR
jgi:hypothetical protein